MAEKIVTAKSKTVEHGKHGKKHKVTHMSIKTMDNGVAITTHHEQPEIKMSRNAMRSGVMRTGMDAKPTETVHKSMASLHQHMDDMYGGLLPADEPGQQALAAGGSGQQPDGDGSENAPDESDAG
jgi:hypothetical protein